MYITQIYSFALNSLFLPRPKYVIDHQLRRYLFLHLSYIQFINIGNSNVFLDLFYFIFAFW